MRALFSASRAAADPVGRRILLLSVVAKLSRRNECYEKLVLGAIVYASDDVCYKIEFTQIIAKLWNQIDRVFFSYEYFFSVFVLLRASREEF